MKRWSWFLVLALALFTFVSTASAFSISDPSHTGYFFENGRRHQFQAKMEGQNFVLPARFANRPGLVIPFREYVEVQYPCTICKTGWNKHKPHMITTLKPVMVRYHLSRPVEVRFFRENGRPVKYSVHRVIWTER